MACGADLEANSLMEDLTSDLQFVIPIIDLTLPEYEFNNDRFTDMYAKLKALKNEDLTQGKVNGEGTFDVLMKGISAQLAGEYKAGRISGAEYTKTYVAMTEAAIQGSIQFLLGKDAAFWNAQTAQIQAITARIQLQTAKMQMAEAQFTAVNSKANYALTKMKLSTESMGYCVAKYNLDFLLPMQLQVQTAQRDMTKEQTEAQRAQTMNTRTDGITPVLGTLGKQRDLYDQQITSYKRDAEVKSAKLFTDAWITMKTMDEGLLPPNGFTNTSLDTILTHLKINNELN